MKRTQDCFPPQKISLLKIDLQIQQNQKQLKWGKDFFLNGSFFEQHILQSSEKVLPYKLTQPADSLLCL